MASCHIPVKQFPIVGFFFFKKKKHMVFSAISLLHFHCKMQPPKNNNKKHNASPNPLFNAYAFEVPVLWEAVEGQCLSAACFYVLIHCIV